MKYNYRNPIFNNSGTIDCEIEHPEYGWIPFTASSNDCEEHGRELYHRIKKDGNVSPYIPPSKEQIESQEREKRNQLLIETDWTQLPDVPENIKSEWVAYRQALRDVPQQPDFPYNIIWPDKPNS
jgi:hypothetical protein